MEKRCFDSIGREISLLGFGLMRLPLAGTSPEDIDRSLARKMVDQALEGGVNYFDTAWIYHRGQSENLAGEALSCHPRDSYNLATKLPLWEVSSLKEAQNLFHEQLKKCRTDHFDFYLMHNINAANYRVMKDLNIYDWFAGQKEKGTIRRLGFSMHDSPRHLELAAGEYQWDFAQIQLNYLDWETLKARELYTILAERHLPAVIMEPLRGGALASLNSQAAAPLKEAAPDASLASWGLRFCASLPWVMTVLSGMSSPEQVADNLKTMNSFKPLSAEDRKILDQAAQSFRASHAIPCTSCRYCEDCPQGVDIPTNFAVYNLYRELDRTDPAIAPEVFGNNYRSLLESEKAHQCASCGECVTHCPQKLDIPLYLKQVADFAASLA